MKIPVHAEAHEPTRIVAKGRARALAKQFAYFLRGSYGVGVGVGSSGPGLDAVVRLVTG